MVCQTSAPPRWSNQMSHKNFLEDITGTQGVILHHCSLYWGECVGACMALDLICHQALTFSTAFHLLCITPSLLYFQDYLAHIIDLSNLPIQPERVCALFGNIEDIYEFNRYVTIRKYNPHPMSLYWSISYSICLQQSKVQEHLWKYLLFCCCCIHGWKDWTLLLQCNIILHTCMIVEEL